MLIAIGEAECADGRRDQMLEAASAMTAASESDDGCERYGFYTDVRHPELLLSVEVWRDHAALAAHMEHPHTQQFLAAVPELVTGPPTMQRFTAEGTG